ncbi:MAG: LysR family transcriptional regulator [Paraburkholderia sp.]|nr:MAG: LysR family transcriptional regulator [Paraburkholderia sp.]
MELRQLESFVHVAELGSFTRASNFLSIAQPVLSRQVRALEVEFRQVLLERNGRGVTLTEAGRRFLEHGRSVLAQIERAQLDMEQGRGALTGRIVVALPPSVSLTLTTALVRAFRDRFPKATLCVLEGLSSYVLEWLTISRADCAVVYTVPTSSAVELAPVLTEQLYLVSRRTDHTATNGDPGSGAISLAEVAQHSLVMPSRPHSIRMLLEATMAQASLKPRIAVEVESIQAILALVRDEGVHAVLSLKAVHSSGRAQEFEVRPIRQPSLETTLWVATSAQRPRGPLLNQTLPLLKDLLLEHWTTSVEHNYAISPI